MRPSQKFLHFYAFFQEEILPNNIGSASVIVTDLVYEGS